MKIAPFIDWISYFNFAFNQINHTITEEEPIVVYSPAYLTNVSLLIEEYNSTPEGRTYVSKYFLYFGIALYFILERICSK